MTDTSLNQKVLQICAHYPPFLGGMENVVHELSMELARKNIEVEVVASSIGMDKNYQDFRHKNYTVTRLPAIEIAQVPLMPRLLWRLLRQPKRSIYHMHIAQAFLPEIAWLAARIRHGKFIAHFHLDVKASGLLGWLFTLYKKTLFPRMLRAADKVIVFSDDQKQLAMSSYGVRPERIAVIPNGVAKRYFLTDKRELHAPPRLLFVGRLSPQKNLSLLLQSLAGVSGKFQTMIVGDGELAPSLAREARDLDLQNVTFAGRHDGDELLDIYRSCDIFVLPSEREGMPLVLLEAMAAGLPVVGTDVIGTRDWIKSGVNGYLAPLGNTDAFRQSLQRAASPDEYEILSINATESVKTYSWPAITEQLIAEVYKS